MGKNGLEYVKRHHDIRVLVDRLENVIVASRNTTSLKSLK